MSDGELLMFLGERRGIEDSTIEALGAWEFCWRISGRGREGK